MQVIRLDGAQFLDLHACQFLLSTGTVAIA